MTLEMVSPLLIGFQCAPPSMVLNTPAPSVAAYSVVGVCGSIASSLTTTSGRPVIAAVQLAPPFVLLNTPLIPPGAAAAAYSVVVVVGSTTIDLILQPNGPLVGVQVPSPASAGRGRL